MHEFWVKKERRDHIFKQATRPDGQKAYLEFQTLERGSPYTLRMTKMNGEYELCNWRVRYDQVKKMVHDIGPAQDMHSLLGHEAFESVRENGNPSSEEQQHPTNVIDSGVGRRIDERRNIQNVAGDSTERIQNPQLAVDAALPSLTGTEMDRLHRIHDAAVFKHWLRMCFVKGDTGLSISQIDIWKAFRDHLERGSAKCFELYKAGGMIVVLKEVSPKADLRIREFRQEDGAYDIKIKGIRPRKECCLKVSGIALGPA
ncbi:hypothetical protein B0A50_00723 [Salinomyces thailandicus]|uniref:Uncharacterized protein n=1 Tax=Salinomyces thailandicus TaxID=706561 RepID=A0A4U0UCG5_9PEZI|nr:hypothetical protein B0A50_00723 [Salinomyces thailandica]